MFTGLQRLMYTFAYGDGIFKKKLSSFQCSTKIFLIIRENLITLLLKFPFNKRPFWHWLRRSCGSTTTWTIDIFKILLFNFCKLKYRFSSFFSKVLVFKTRGFLLIALVCLHTAYNQVAGGWRSLITSDCDPSNKNKECWFLQFCHELSITMGENIIVPRTLRFEGFILNPTNNLLSASCEILIALFLAAR